MKMIDSAEENLDESNDHLKNIVGRTQKFKTKMMSFLGNSSEIFSGISNKLESALSLSGYDTEDTSTRQLTTPSSNTGSEHGAAMPAATRKLNALPTFGLTFEDYEALMKHRKKCITLRRKSLQRHAAGEIRAEKCDVIGEEPLEENDSTDNELGSLRPSPSIESKLSNNFLISAPDTPAKDKLNDNIGSESASELDDLGQSPSVDSSGSEGFVHSWASSLSLDSQSDENVVEFMRFFVATLFKDSGSINQERKAQFGEMCQTETGRLWFSRFVNAQRTKSKRVNEATFYALIQYFATVLFECAEAEDYSPSKSLMNMCFTFYLEVDVPGCEPYKEYLYTYLRHQPIWHTLRFWNAAFFDALQCERVHKPIATRDQIKYKNVLTEEMNFQENITFGQLGTFTYNMHAFGLSRELCLEFLRKQCAIANLNQEQENLLKQNIEKMYSETEMWRQK